MATEGDPDAAVEDPSVTAQVVRAWELKSKGRTVREIAAELGVSPATAHRRMRAAATAEDAVYLLDRAEMRSAQAGRLEWYLSILARRIDGGQPPEVIVPVMLKVETRLADLLGLNAPSRLIVDGPERGVSPATLAAIRQAQKDFRPEESEDS